MPKYDVRYGDEAAVLDYHFCREFSEDGNGCFGTNPTHGLSFDEAKEAIAAWHEDQAKGWRSLTEAEWQKPEADQPG